MTTRARITPGDGDPRHGTPNGYKNLRCRCGPCQKAHREDAAAERRRRTPPPPGDPRHGRYTTYQNWGCRCGPCTAAHTMAHYQWRKGADRLCHCGLAVADDYIARTGHAWHAPCGPPQEASA